MGTKINYANLMSQEPTRYGQMLNTKSQIIEFYEHPTKGDEAPVIAVCHKLKAAGYTGFFELDDMKATHGEYEPSFDEDGVLWIGEFEAEW